MLAFAQKESWVALELLVHTYTRWHFVEKEKKIEAAAAALRL